MSVSANAPAPGPSRVAEVESVPPLIPNHRLLRRVGQGSYGEVWLALDAMNKWTAVKVVHIGSGDHTRAFEQEFRGLKHYDELANTDGSLMPIRNVGRDEQRGCFYYSMELADDARTRAPLNRIDETSDPGAVAAVTAEYEPWTLSTELRLHGRLPPRECARHAVALAEALEKLHAGKVLHRDIKPSNIIFVRGRPKLADVGLVTLADGTQLSLAGTSGFAPFHGSGTISGDLFALGKVLYLMGTGRHIGEFPKEAVDLDGCPDAERVEQAELQAVYDRACDHDPKRRYATAREMRGDLELLLRNESVLRYRRLEDFARRWRIGLALGAPLIVILLFGFAFSSWRTSVAHRGALAELESRKLSRMQLRYQGWSAADWNQAVQAGRREMDVNVLRQAVATLSGLDAKLTSHWRKVEATSASFSSDGRILLSGAHGSPASLITDLTNRIELPITGEGKVGWAGDGEPVILLVESNAFALREARTGFLRRAFVWPEGEDGNPSAAPVIALSLDCQFGAGLLMGGNSNRVVVWQTESGTLLGQFATDASCLAFAPDNSRLAVGHANGGISVVRLDRFQLEALLPVAVGQSPVLALAFGEDLKVPLEGPGEERRWLLAAGHRGTGIVVWDLSSRLPRSFCHGSTWDVESVAFHPDGLTMASAGRMGVRFWDIATGRQLLLTLENGSNTRALAFNSDGSLLVSGASAESSPADICVWAVETHRGIQRLRGLSSTVRKVTFSPDGLRIAALSDEWLLAVWDVTSGRLLRLFEVPAGRYADSAGLVFNADGDQLAISTATEANLLDVRSGRRAWNWRLSPGAFGDQLQFDDTGQLVLARVALPASAEKPRLWEVYQLKPDEVPAHLAVQAETSYSTANVSMTIGGRRLVVFAHDRRQGFDSIRGVDLPSGRELWAHTSRAQGGWYRIPVDPTGRWAAVLGMSKPETSLLIGVEDGRLGDKLPRCLAVGAGGRLAVGYNSEASYAFLIHTDRPRAELPLETDGQLHGDTYTFTQDGTLVASGCTEGAVFVADVAVLKRKIEQLALHSLRPNHP